MFPLPKALPVLCCTEAACGACGSVQEAALVSPLDPGAGVLLGCCGRLFQGSNSVSLGIVLAGMLGQYPGTWPYCEASGEEDEGKEEWKGDQKHFTGLF